jgi:hypothetical protein
MNDVGKVSHAIARRAVFALAGAIAVAGARPARSAGLALPQGKVVLSVSGLIKETNKDGAAELDMTMLEAIGTASFTTSTPWYNTPVTFSGVPMAKLLDYLGASGTTITAYALNDYKTDIPIEDFRKFPAILATKRDGAYMPVRDKGPLFIVYPYDSDPNLKHQVYYSRSAWQVARMVVR